MGKKLVEIAQSGQYRWTFRYLLFHRTIESSIHSQVDSA